MAKQLMACVVVAAAMAAGGPALGGLAHYWTFDADVSNSVAGGLDGVIVGEGVSITSVADEFVRGSGGLKIDHDTPGGDYVHIEGAVIPAFDPTAFTIATWYKFDGSLGSQATDSRNFLWETVPNWTSGVGLRNDAGARDLEWFFNGTPTIVQTTTGPVVNDDQWHHVAIVYDNQGDTARMYHDGAPHTTVAANTLLQPTTGLNIGNHRAGDGGRNWSGFVDDFAVFDGTLDDAGVAGLYDGTYTPETVPVTSGPPAPGPIPTGAPVAYWTFDDDFSSEVNNDFFAGVPEGGEFTRISTAAEAKIGTGALKLDSGPQGGNGTYVDIQREVADVARDKQITVSAWYKFEDTGEDGSDGRNFVWESAPGYSLSFGLRDDAGTRDAEWWFHVIANDTSGPEITPGEWNHVVMVLDQDAELMQFYHNGALRDEVATGGNLIPVMSGFHIGNHRAGDGGRDFDGYIDDVAVYHGVLLPDAVAGLYDGTYTPLTVPVAATIPEPGTLALMIAGAIAGMVALLRRRATA